MPSPAGTIVTKRSDPTSLRKDILSLLRNNGHKIFRPKEIAKELNIRDNDAYRDFRRVLQEMEDEKAVVRVRRGHITLPRKPSKIRGTLRVNPKGFGFLEVEGETDDLYVRESNMANALDGDIVMAGLAAPTRGDKRREAEILEVIERKRTRVVGTFRKKGHFAFVVPDDVRVTQDVYVPESAFSGASDGDKVVVSIDAFEDRKASPEGRVLEVIGPSSDSRVQVLSLAMSYDVRAGFPDEVVKQAEKIPAKIPASEIDRRLDLREYPIFTIDPADAKDLDDAIHIRTLENGNYEIGVHIADVSHFVESGSALDREAFERATSVYLVDRVMPMLPEKLSNGVCSLNPNEDKLTFSVMVEISTTGAVKNYDIRETIIHSKQRFSYEEAQALLEGKKAESPLAADIQTAGKLAKTLTKRRMKNGAVDFDLPEVKVELDDSGKPIRLYRKQRMDANRLIEEFMLLANRVVARSVRRKKKEMTFIYRVHDQTRSREDSQAGRIRKSLRLQAASYRWIRRFSRSERPPLRSQRQTRGGRNRTGGPPVDGEGRLFDEEHRPLRVVLQALQPLYEPDPPLSRPHGASAPEAICRGRWVGRPAGARSVVRTLLRQGAIRRRG
jgi:ribonuclease R